MSTALLLVALLAVTFGLYLWGPDWGVPNAARRALYPADSAALVADFQTPMATQFYKTSAIVSFHPDEFTLIKAFLAMHPARLDLNPHFYAYPSLCIYLLGAALETGKALHLVTPTNDRLYYFTHPDAAGALFIASRILFAVLGVVGVGALFWVTRRLYDSRTAFIAAAVLALTPEWLRESHFVAVNVPMAVFMTLAVGASLMLRESRRPLLWIIAAGAMVGLATGSKYHGVLIGGVALLCVFEGWRQERGGIGRLVARLLALGGATVLAFLISTPYALFDHNAFLHDLLTEYTLKVVDPSVLPVGPPQWAGLVIVSFGVPILLLAAVGGGVALGEWASFRTRVLVVWAVPFLAVFAITHIIYARYITPIAPLVAILAAVGLGWLVARVGKRGRVGLLVAIGAAAVILFNAATAETQFGQSPQMTAATWLRANLPRGSHILMFDTPSFDAPPLDNSYYTVQVNGQWQAHDFDAIIFTSVNRWIPDQYRPLRRALLDSKAETATFDGFSVRQFSSRPPLPIALPDDSVPEDWKYTESSVFILYQPSALKK